MTETKNSDSRIDDSKAFEVLCSLEPSPSRALIGAFMLVLLAGFLFYIGFGDTSTHLASRVAIPALGIASLYSAFRIYSVSQDKILLTRDALRTRDGTLVANVGNIERVETGLLAMKPSNGFLVVLKEPMRRAWYPGLWWRFGKRIGIGGITSKHGGKVMAGAIASLMNSD
ncbi:MAG: hypothetical protein OXI87_06855 [Albidovulum sp.]|nr:hypothetical protein [Albidovulum sp.]MDE0304588.1 hypothetical protein [Albidovulum sp.]MDE0531496.1 hypothetical protein [Albidovulum sp.]